MILEGEPQVANSGLALTVGLAVEAVRETAPFVHIVAPQSATAFVGDVLHAAGAHAVMTGTEPLDAAAHADALVLDVGTAAGDLPDDTASVPWVLDVTRLGRAPLDADRVRSLLAHAPGIVRADAREVDGVRIDAGTATLVLGESAELVVAGGREVAIPRGPEMLTHVPGVRSAVSALIGACAAVASPVEAALAGAAWLALSSERAEQGNVRGPASFRTALLDELWTVRGDEVARYLDLH